MYPLKTIFPEDFLEILPVNADWKRRIRLCGFSKEAFQMMVTHLKESGLLEYIRTGSPGTSYKRIRLF